MADDPILSNRPTALTRALNKYRTGSETMTGLAQVGASPSTIAGIRQLDVQRANLGRNPFTATETVLGAKATEQKAPVVDEPGGNGFGGFLSNLAGNVQTIVSEVPKLPITIYRETAQVPDLATQIPQALAKGQSPIEDLGNLASLPGLRLIPGSFVASQFGTGGQGVTGLVDNPLFTALDVLPYASKAARLTDTFKVAEELRQANAAAYAEAGVPTHPRPITTVLTRWSPGEVATETVNLRNTNIPVEQVTPNLIGRTFQSMAEKISDTAPGRWSDRAFSRAARMDARAYNRFSADAAAGDLPLDSPANQVGVSAAKQLSDEAIALGNEFRDQIPADRMAEINRAVQVGNPEGVARLGLSDIERSYLDRYNAAQDRFTQTLIDQNEGLTRVQYPHGEEIYDTPTANRITNARDASAAQYAMAKLRNTLDPASPYTASVDELLTDARAMVDDPRVTMAQKRYLSRAYAQALDNAGVDVAKLKVGIGKANKTTLSQIWGEIDTTATPRPAAITDALEQLRSMRRTDPTVETLYRSLSNEDFATAQQALDSLRRRKTFTVDLNLDDLRADIARRKATKAAIRGVESQKWGKDPFTDKGLQRATDRVARVEAGAVPARFQPAVMEQFGKKVSDQIRESYTGADINEVLDRVSREMFPSIDSLTPYAPDAKAFLDDARKSWQDLKAQGYDPTFVHHVSPQRASSLMFPRVLDFTPSLSQVKGRLWAPGAQVTDLSVALNSRAMEYLIQQGSKAYVDWFAKSHAIPLEQAQAEFAGMAERALEKNPGLNYQAHLEKLVAQKYKPWDPESFINPSSAKGNPATTLVAPRGLVDNMELLRPKPSEIGKLVDPVMKVFRTSLLPLSPRWHVYNILGGAMMLMASAENPLTVWKYARDAKRLMGAMGDEGLLGTRGSQVKGAIREGVESEATAARTGPPAGATREASKFLRDVDLTSQISTDGQKTAALYNYAGGRTLKRLWDSNVTERVLRDPFNSVVQKSYDINQWFDDFYRSMAYMEGFDRSITKGLSREEAIMRGVDASRKILQNWDTITPLERSTMRFLFPFYGWTRTLMRYVLSYPGDHPWRTSILSNFARAEMTDQNLGLPQRLRDLLFYGDVDANGNQAAVNLSGANPFRDVSNWFTLAGFMQGEGDLGAITSQVNPLISTVLQWAGVDPSTGSPDLYPDMRFDPTSGRLVAAPKETPILGVVGNLLPQSRVLMSLTGMSNQFREMAKTNPQGAARMLGSNLGIPALFRDVNVPQEVTKAEAQRYQFMKDELNKALAAGDIDSFIAQYPKLAAFATMAQKIKAGDSKYTPDPNLPGGRSPGTGQLVGGVGRMLNPLG